MVLRTTFFLLFLGILHITFFHDFLLSLSETFRSVKNFILAFLKRSEAWKTSFWPFWNVQKREKLLFGLSEMFRSVKNFILAFLKCSGAWKISFWSFWNVQKHEKLHFGLSETFRSMKNLHLVFLKCSEAWKIKVWFIFLREIACFLCGVVHDLWFLLFKGFQLLAKIMILLIKKKQSFAFLMYNLIFW